MRRIFLLPLVIAIVVTCAWIYTDAQVPKNCYVTAGKEPDIETLCPTTLTRIGEGQRYDIKVNLCGVIPVKTVSVTVLGTEKVIPGGQVFGVKFYCDGLIVINIDNGSPAAKSGICVGDIITKVNGSKISQNEKLAAIVSSGSGKELTLTYTHDGKECKASVRPKLQDGEYKLGLWVRDSAAGLGTMTFYNPSNGTFGALGHSISDADTARILPLRKGIIIPAAITGIVKGNTGSPGQLSGTFLDSSVLGNVLKNCDCGIFGTVDSAKNYDAEPVEIGLSGDVKTGKATILCTLDSTGVQEYDIEIVKINRDENQKTKNMLIKVTDAELLEKTGGIVQGMSGSPIIQNGKLIGAVTHVLVSDPKQGYAVFIENMLAECEPAA